MPGNSSPGGGKRLKLRPLKLRRPGTVRRPADPLYLRILFDRNAASYDRVNPVLSLGRVHLWRHQTVTAAAISKGGRVLDAFSGPGSLGVLALGRVGAGGQVDFADLSPEMLAEARLRVRKRIAGLERKVRKSRKVIWAKRPGPSGDRWAFPEVRFLRTDLLAPQAAADRQPPYDAILFGFGLRYTSDAEAALRQLRARLRPGGYLGLLEFTSPAGRSSLPDRLSHTYFYRILPQIGSRVTGDPELYEYLRDSSASLFTPADLVHYALRAGFEVKEIRTAAAGLVTIISARNRYSPTARASSVGTST
ncbi:MAG: bifunctional demethylmenaquinone methyltransferase/2-methoxy-6-polyprenyl-1,4-benzoquinol methylase UbiE [Thermoleophilia bacterium]